MSLPGTAHGLVLWWQLDMLPKELHQHHQQQQQPQQTSSSQSSDTFWLSTAPEYVGTDVSQGGDGGPLQGVRQEWRGHWAQCWSRLGGAAGLQVSSGKGCRCVSLCDSLISALLLPLLCAPYAHCAPLRSHAAGTSRTERGAECEAR